MGSRRKAREAVLKALYLTESRDISFDSAFKEMSDVDREITELADDPEAHELKPFALGLDEKQMVFAVDLAHKIVDSTDWINSQIEPVLQNWDISRVARIDRLIMWIAIAEMKFMLDIPVNVSINEALELAKKYSSDKSPSFVNGILDAVARNFGAI